MQCLGHFVILMIGGSRESILKVRGAVGRGEWNSVRLFLFPWGTGFGITLAQLLPGLPDQAQNNWEEMVQWPGEAVR